MLVDVYTALMVAGAILGATAMLHHSIVSWRRSSREMQELADALKARERGEMVPLPTHDVFYRGTLTTAAFAAFAVDGIVSFITGTFELGDVVMRAAWATVAGGGIQYAVTMLRRDKRPMVWPNSPWLAWVVTAALGLLGGLAEASDPGPMR